MRIISEYTGSQHNVRSGSVTWSDGGISVDFFSDKSSRYNSPVKHRLVPWNMLPPKSREFLDVYREKRPRNALHFFCKKDGRPLSRKNIVDMLDVCLIQTSHRFLRIVPHSFRVGGSSHRHLFLKMPISEVMFEGNELLWSVRITLAGLLG